MKNVTRITNPITDINLYNESMSKSTYDKLFFIDKIFDDTIEQVFDYGCGDGIITDSIGKLMNCQTIGYDKSKEMIKKSLSKNITNLCYSDLHTALGKIKDVDKTILYLSSVLHEISTYDDLDKFYEFMLESGFKYIVIRDMLIREDDGDKEITASELASTMFSDATDIIRLEEFCSVYGSMTNRRNFIHYLLKYRYTVNWSRELNENYIVGLNYLLNKVKKDGRYEVHYIEEYTLPFVKHCIKQDFEIDLKYNTHTKLILKRRGK